MNPFAWYIKSKKTFEPKSHFKRTCHICVTHGGKVGCTLPFRKTKRKIFTKFVLMAVAEKVEERRRKNYKR